MKYRIAVGIAATLAAVLAPTPQAQAQQVMAAGSAGAWVWGRGLDTTGHRVCIAGSTAGPRNLVVKHYADDNFITIEVRHDGWSIPQNAKVRFAMKFDNASPWGDAQSVAGGTTIQASLHPEEMVSFLTQFRLAKVARIYFLDSNEPVWTMSLRGSAAVTLNFIHCAQNWTVNAQGPQRRQESKRAAPRQTRPFSKGDRPMSSVTSEGDT